MRNAQAPGIALDSLDFAIIRALSEQPAITNKALAAAVGSAESTCAFRVRKLRESGVIRPHRLEVDHRRLGYPLRAVVMVFMVSHSRENVERFMQAMVGTPNVIQVMNLTGRFDFMVTVAVADGDELQGIVLDHITTHPAVRGTETHIVFDVREGSWIPPLHESSAGQRA